ncbi:NAD(P)-binding protein [Cystobasidium minutum MCA 4210]|uniref:NAD(P)-binding protein n=1 Tax=Cystobasidium minutum MCA 4210 TaxID=1397322 RepID=UPI0034CD92AC|eukprot:jgi/Rhomi1/194374/gm1.2588_g
MAGIVDTVKNTIAENFTGGNNVAPEQNKFTHDDVPDLTNKVAVVTGGSEGIGYGVTNTLLSHNIKKVYILSLSKEVVDGAQKAIAEELGQDKADRTKWLHVDLSDWDSVPAIAKQILNDTDRLDILVNNAARGIMTFDKNKAGVDLHMALNHMGHVILTTHLLPLLKKTAEAGNTVRIVNLSSNAHQGAPSDVKFESLDELNQDLGPNPLYGRSKLATLLYSRYMAKHLTPSEPNILINATHPGFVDTRQSAVHIHEPYPLGGYAMSVGMKPFKKTAMEGALSSLYAATVTKDSGKYICPPAAIEEGSSHSQDEQLMEQLMKLTRDVITQKSKALNDDKGGVLPFY